MFNIQASDWNIVKASPYGKDIPKQYTDARAEQGMKVGIHYSHEKDWWQSKKVRHYPGKLSSKYIEFVKQQLHELLSNYGKIDIIWLDMGIAQNQSLNQMCHNIVRELKPDCIISGRIGSGLGDYKNLGDRELASPGEKDYVESIMTLRLNRGFDKNDRKWKNSRKAISMISKTACRSSNFLLNIGPQPDGSFTPEEKVRLHEIGKWMDKNSDAIYSNKGSPFKGEFPWGSIRYKADKIFVHFIREIPQEIEIGGIKSTILEARVLANNRIIPFIQKRNKIFILASEKNYTGIREKLNLVKFVNVKY